VDRLDSLFVSGADVNVGSTCPEKKSCQEKMGLMFTFGVSSDTAVMSLSAPLVISATACRAPAVAERGAAV
jgi:hypothetical protein